MVVFFMAALLGSAFQKAMATIQANPSTVYVVNNSEARSTTLTWATPPGVPAQVSLQMGSGGEVWTDCLSAANSGGGSCLISYITLGNTYRFRLYGHAGTSQQYLISSVNVSGVLPTGSLAANPQLLYLDGNASGTTTLSWSAPVGVDVQVALRMNGGSPVWTDCYGSAGSGACQISYVTAGNTYQFLLYANPGTERSLLLASTEVVGLQLTGELQASQTSVAVPPSGAGSVGLQWAAPAGVLNQISVSKNNSTEGWTDCYGYGSTGTCTINYITAGDQFLFRLYTRADSPTRSVLATVLVTGLPNVSGTLSANPEIVVIPAGQTSASTQLSWATTGAQNVRVSVFPQGGGTEVFHCSGLNGSCTFGGISAGQNYQVRLYSGYGNDISTLLDEVLVQGRSEIVPECDFVFSEQSLPPTNLAALGTGKSVCLMPGDYLTTQAFNLGTSQRLIGLGATPAATVLRGDAVGQAQLQTVVGAASSAEIRNLTIRGANSHVPTYGVLSYHLNNVKVEDVHVRQVLIGIGVVGGSQFTAKRVDIRQNGLVSNGVADPSMWITGVTGVTIEDSVFEGTIWPGVIQDADGGTAIYHSSNVSFVRNLGLKSGIVYLWDVQGGVISDNESYEATEWALDIVEGTADVVFSNNHVEDAGWGASVIVRTSNLLFEDNVFIGNNRFGWASCGGINDIHIDGVTSNSGLISRRNSNLEIDDKLPTTGSVTCRMDPL
jgi:hypothetical protein